MMLRWLRLDSPRQGSIEASNGSFYILQRGEYIKRGDDVGSEWHELVWSDVEVLDGR